MLVVACTQPIPVVDETAPPPIPAGIYEQAALDGASVYRVDALQSVVLVRVGRDGAMRRLGHDHAVASEDVAGLVALYDENSLSRTDIAIPVRNLLVDEAEYRQRLDLDTQPTADDVAGTYTNMLKVFEPETYPWVQIHGRFAAGSEAAPELAVSITLHGATREFIVPVDIEKATDRLVVSGTASVRHSDFGIEPYSAAGGLLRVADELDVEFHLVAKRLDGSG